MRKNRGTGTPIRLVKAKGSYTRSGLIIDNMLQKYDTKYDYTPGGNISRKKQSAWGVGTEGNSITDVNLSYDNEYKYNPLKPHAVTKVGSTEYTYDLDGRMTGSYDSSSKFKRTFTWDEEGRLLKTVDNKHTTDYRYDANGERICKYSDLGETIYASGYYTETDGKKISKHIYIGSTRVASQVMSRSCETSTTMKRENTLYYHTDHLGSSGYVTDKKGEFYEHTEYTSSGESWVNEKVTGNANLPFKYTSKEQDAETGLYYYGARYYDARTSRWISTDPILEKYLPTGNKERNKNLPGMGGIYNSVNLNMYHYAGNNPVVMTDPDGRAIIIAYKGKGYYFAENRWDRATSKLISGGIPFVGEYCDNYLDSLLGIYRIRGEGNPIKSSASNIADAGDMLLNHSNLIKALRDTGDVCKWISWAITGVEVIKAWDDGKLLHEIVLERSGILDGYDPKFIRSVVDFAEAEVKTMIKKGDVLISKEGDKINIYANKEKMQELKDDYKLMYESWKKSNTDKKGK